MFNLPMNRPIIYLASLLTSITILTSCQQKSTNQNSIFEITPEMERFADQSGTLNIAGGTAHIPVMKKSAKAIMQSFPDIKITIAGGGSGVGAQQVGSGLVDIGNTGRALKESEAQLGLVSFPFAIDGVAIIVSRFSPIQNLTSQQVSAIYAGKVTNWKDVGGADQSIHIFTRDEASGTRSVFIKKLLKKGAVTENANVVASNGAMKTAISNDPGAIGYCSIGYIDETVKAPQLDGVQPDKQSCIEGEYPVVRQLYMNTKGAPQGLTKAFIDFIKGPQGSTYILSSGYIPISTAN
jgi:phosphate transport system substrate-binding protein